LIDWLTLKVPRDTKGRFTSRGQANSARARLHEISAF
jgi:hypothetical protein